MASAFRKWPYAVLMDLFLILFALFVARYFINLPRWYYLVLCGIIWVFFGVAGSKLDFTSYRRARNAVAAILIVNVISSVTIYFTLNALIPDASFRWTHIALVVCVTLLEIGGYFILRKYAIKKIPYFLENEPVINPDAEPGYKDATKYDPSIGPKELTYLRESIEHLSIKEAVQWCREHRKDFSEGTKFIDSRNEKVFYEYATQSPTLFIVANPFDSIRHLNTFLANANMMLPIGGYISGHCITAGLKREKIREDNPPITRDLFIAWDFFWNRFCPKVFLLKQIYFALTDGRHRVFTRVEILGRLCMAGFEIMEDDIRNGEFFVSAKKTSPPLAVKPNTDILIRLKRVGMDRKEIGVYKFRTMHSYSEYLQSYVYQHNGLQKGGKVEDDFRITDWGKFMRKTWIDELPMLINWLKGDLKLVGVRPLSFHYFGLYTDDMQALRVKTKPGLVPPYYAEAITPELIEDVQANERRYLEQYFARPFATDWKYFWKAVKNILLKGKRSK